MTIMASNICVSLQEPLDLTTFLSSVIDVIDDSEEMEGELSPGW